jgi:Zn-finger nucleic acid-binding protein
MRKCPVSGEPMARETLHGVTIDTSPHGMWFDKGELFSVTETERHEAPEWVFADLFRRVQAPPVDERRALQCPECGETMNVEKLHDVHIDWCKEHGVWLDNGELEAMLNNLRLDPLFLGKVATRLWELRY